MFRKKRSAAVIITHQGDGKHKIPTPTVAPWAGKPVAQQLREARALMRRVFGTTEGRIALALILEDLKYFDEATTDAQKALRNYATFLLMERMGIGDGLAITNALLDNAAKE